MTRRKGRTSIFALLAGAFSLATLLFVVAPAGGAVTFSQEDVTGFVFQCTTTSFTAQSGTIEIVEHDGVAANGNTNFTVTATAKGVVLLGSDGQTYRERGALWFGGTTNANTGLSNFTFTGKVQFIGPGGTGGTINLTMHVSPNGTVKDFDFGDCQFPA
jgi:hypothetical protein